MNNLKKIELEITSDCNAACPGCARTLNVGKYEVVSFTFEDIKRLFPTREHINGKEFKFCGVLGDPIVNPDCLKMMEWLVYNGGYCEISTNGAYQTTDWWTRLGQVATAYPGKIHIHFCADGHKETNHIYRVNTKWNVLERNMQAFSDAAPANHATWIYIVFDHNEHELATAEEHAKRLNFNFATRTGMRNSYHDWVAQLTKKQDGKIVKETKKITTTGAKEHSKKALVHDLDKFIKEYNEKKADKEKTEKILNSIVCKYVHEGEIFIASDLTMWPCCFLWDTTFKNNKLREKLAVYDTGWNSLKTNSIEEVMQHPWYQEVLALSWDPEHPQHFTRCIKTCAYNKAYHNEIIYKEKQ